MCWPWHPPHVLLPKPHSPLHPWKILRQHKFYPWLWGFFGYDLLCAAFQELLGIGKCEGAKGQMSGAEVSGKQRNLQTPSKGFGSFEILLQLRALLKSILNFAARVLAVLSMAGIAACARSPAHGLEHPHSRSLPGTPELGTAQPWFVNTKLLFRIARPVPKPNTALLVASMALPCCHSPT